MAKIGVQTWGTQGDVQPFLALANALGARGHEVELSMATASDARYEAAPGVTLTRPQGESTRAQMTALVHEIAQIKSPLKQAKAMMAQAFEPYVASLAQASQAQAAGSALIVRHHFLFMAQAAAYKHNIPEISVFLTPDLLPTKHRPPTGMPSLGPLQALAWRMMEAAVGPVFLPPAQRHAQAMGLPIPKKLLQEVWSSRTANLIAASPALCPAPADWPEIHKMVGFIHGPLNTQATVEPGLEAFLAAGAPPIYATFGSMTPMDEEGLAATTQLFIEAAKRAGQRIIVEAPGQQPALAQADEQVYFVQQSPHARIFPRCAAVIHHGGAGTTQTTLRAGKPAIIVPHMADQFFWAAQLQRLGCARSPAPRQKLSALRLAEAITQTVGDQDMTARCAQLRAQLDQEDGLTRAVQVIEQALG